MPTVRPRHLITETDRVTEALAVAAKRWPEDAHSRARLLTRLVEEGHRALDEQQEHAVHDHRAVVERTSGALTGMYPADYLTQLREDWPE